MTCARYFETPEPKNRTAVEWSGDYVHQAMMLLTRLHTKIHNVSLCASNRGERSQKILVPACAEQHKSENRTIRCLQQLIARIPRGHNRVQRGHVSYKWRSGYYHRLCLAVPTAHQYSGFAFPNEDGVRTGLGARSARQSNKNFKSGISDARSSSANNRAPSQGLCCTSHKSRLRDPPSATRHVPLCRSRVEIRPKLVERSKGNTRRTSRGYATRQTEQAVVGKAEVDWQSKLRSQDTMETVAERNTRTSSQA
nr:uncharacterized protein LOC115260164 [Aedes albopictus]